MRLTPAGWGAVAAATGLYSAGELLGYPVLRLLAGACVGAVALSAVQVARRASLRADREVFPSRVERDGDSVARLRVHNAGRRESALFTAFERAGTQVLPVRVPSLSPGHGVTRTYRLPTGRRGVLPVGPLVLAREDALGLVRADVRSAAVTHVWVHPRTHPVVPVAAGRSRQYEGAPHHDTERGTQLFHSLREYVRGDDVRTVHWRTTARIGKLMVKDQVDLHTPDLTVLLDTSDQSLSPAQFEEAVEFAASLVRASAEEGFPVRLMTGTGTLSRPSAGSTGAMTLLDRLAEVDQGAGGGELLARLGREVRGSCLVFVGGRIGDTTLKGLGRARSRFRFVAAADFDPPAAPPALAPVLVIRQRSAATAAHDWNAAVAR
jgi:uncharacterized protein (DUF58 family)